jgi:hypothetical protein
LFSLDFIVIHPFLSSSPHLLISIPFKEEEMEGGRRVKRKEEERGMIISTLCFL